jgi:hypothetical protein
MLIIKVFIFAIAAFFFKHFSQKRSLGIILMLLFSHFISSSLVSNILVLRIISVLQIFGLAGFFIYFIKRLKIEHSDKLIFKSLIILTGIIFCHNIIDLNSKDLNIIQEKAVEISNPWGLFLSFWFVFSNSSIKQLDAKELIHVEKLVAYFSFTLAVILILTFLGLLEGNTSKKLQGSGGIGIGNLSTNDTALTFLCFFVFSINNYVRTRKNKTLFLLLIISLSIFLTESRLAIICLVLIVSIFLLVHVKKKVIFFLSPVLLIVFFFIFIVVRNRMLYDLNPRLPSGLEWVHFGSGRLVIYAEYVISYVENYSHSFQNLIFGIGYYDLVEVYSKSNLFDGGWVLKDYHFYPIHSDLFLIFYITGFLGLLLTVIILLRMRLNSLIKISMFLVFILFITFDMINYSQFSCLLIGIGLFSVGNKNYSKC